MSNYIYIEIFTNIKADNFENFVNQIKKNKYFSDCDKSKFRPESVGEFKYGKGNAYSDLDYHLSENSPFIVLTCRNLQNGWTLSLYAKDTMFSEDVSKLKEAIEIQKEIAKFFNCDVRMETEHILDGFDEGEIEEDKIYTFNILCPKNAQKYDLTKIKDAPCVIKEITEDGFLILSTHDMSEPWFSGDMAKELRKYMYSIKKR